MPAYTFKASFDRIVIIYERALRESNVDIKSFMPYIIAIFGDNNNKEYSHGQFNAIVKLFKSKTKLTVPYNILPPPPDDGIDMIMEAIEKVNAYGQVGKGMRRRFSRRKRQIKIRRLTMRKN